MDKRIKERVAAKAKRADGREELILLPPNPRAWKYDIEFLELADQLEEALGRPILNPRQIDNVSLEAVDLDWLADMAAYRDRFKYYEQFPKRPAWLR